MSSENHFGTGKGRVDDDTVRRVNEIARKHGAWFISGPFPGEGYRYWFSTRVTGSPFVEAIRDAVYADLDRAGIVLPGRVKKSA